VRGTFAANIRLGIIVLLLAGCVSLPPVPSHLQRTSFRILVMPSTVPASHPEAQITVDKAWEDVLRARGFDVVSADRALTYVGARGLSLKQLRAMPLSRIGRDMKVDGILLTEVARYDTQYAVLAAGTVVAGGSQLVEASTEAVIWGRRWAAQSESGGGRNLGDALAQALVQALADKMFDQATSLARQAIGGAARSIPPPGFDPPAPAAP
jgi:hypothetical protein